MSILRIKSKDLNQLNESLQRISLFEDDVKKSDIKHDETDDTFYTDIDTDNEEIVANNISDNDDISFVDENDSPETKKQKLIADFTNALSSEMEINQRLQQILNNYAEIQNTEAQDGSDEWIIDNKKHDIYLKDEDAHIFRQNRNICLTIGQQVRTFHSNKELNDYLSKHNLPQVDEQMMNNLVESNSSTEKTLTEAPLWSKFAKMKDWGANTLKKKPTSDEDITPEEIWDAVENNKLNFLKACIDHKVNLNVLNKEGETPLTYAAKEGLQDVVNILSKDQNLINQPDRGGWTPLMNGVIPKNREEITKTLLDNGANPNLTDKDNKSVYDIVNQHPERYGDVINILPLTPERLVDVIHTRNSQELDKVLQSKDIDKTINAPMGDLQQTPLMLAAQILRATDVQKLIDAGGDISMTDVNYRTPVMYAAESEKSDPKTMQVLIDAGADVDTPDIKGKSARDYYEARTGRQLPTKQQPQQQAQDTMSFDDDEEEFTQQATANSEKNSQQQQTTSSSNNNTNNSSNTRKNTQSKTTSTSSNAEGGENIEISKADNRLDIIKTLIDNGKADVNAVNPYYNFTSLDFADTADDEEASEYLKSKGAVDFNTIKKQAQQAKSKKSTRGESISDLINSLKGQVSLQEEEPIEECMGAGVTTANLAPAVTQTIYKRPTKKKK